MLYCIKLCPGCAGFKWQSGSTSLSSILSCCWELPSLSEGMGGGGEADEEKLAPLPKWLCLGNGIFDICLADKTHHQIWRGEGQCPCYQIGMVWHLVWWLPVLSGDWEALRTKRQCWGGSRIKSLWWVCGEISPFCMSACNPRNIKSSYSNEIRAKDEQNMPFKLKKRGYRTVSSIVLTSD